jgi:YD repeat-containing protein
MLKGIPQSYGFCVWIQEGMLTRSPKAMFEYALVVSSKVKRLVASIVSKDSLTLALSAKCLAALLLFALIAPTFFIGEFGKAQAQARLSEAPPVSILPEPYLVSSPGFYVSNGQLFETIVNSASRGYEKIAGFLSGEKTPEGLGAATPPATLSERFFGFFASSVEWGTTRATKNSIEPAALAPSSSVAFDFDGDSRADIGRWQASSFQYKIYNSASEDYTMLNLGSSSSKIAPADFDGDGKFDMAVFSAGSWTVRKSSTNSNWSVTWGTTGDLPIAGDYDGDGTADFAIYRPSTNTFWVLTSGSGYASYTSTALGSSGDIVVPGDFDGDHKADCAVFRPSNGHWYHLPSSGGSMVDVAWGVLTDIPAPGDFDSDSITDRTVFRPSTGTWYVHKSSGGSPNYFEKSWGNLGDQPVPADYDGDGTSDIAIYRPTTGAWWILTSGSGFKDSMVFNLGTSSDTAVPSAYLKQSGAELYPDQLSPARLAPINATGGTNLYSRNFGWSTGLVSLPGRSGMDLNIGMSYNSLVWTKVGSTMAFDMDHSNIAPGFNFGFPRIEPPYVSSQTSILSYLMVSPSGARTEFRQTAASDVYETADSSYAQVKVDNPTDSANNPTPIEDITLTITGTDGTQMSYAWIGGAYRCTRIKDRNGNYIDITNNTDGLLTSVVDTLGRTVTVNYDAYSRPSSITQNWQMDNGHSSTTATHTWASFTYTMRNISTNFATGLAVYGPANNTSISVLQKVTYADGSHTDFSYNAYGQVYKIETRAPNNDLLNYDWKNIESPSSNQPDCPRFTQTKTKIANFNLDSYGVAQEIVVNNSIPASSSYSLPGSISGTATEIDVSMDDDPYDSVTKTYVGSSGWNEALPIATEDYADNGSGVARQRWTWSNWTQDNPNVSYAVNPRVTETRVGDVTNTKRTTVEYYPVSTGSSVALYGLVKNIKVYDNDLSVLKEVYNEYNLDSAYVSRRIIGLPSMTRTAGYNQVSLALEVTSKVTYNYDEGAMNDTGLEQNISPIKHDPNFSSSFVTGRGNLTSATRWDAADESNPNKTVSVSTKYNTAGAPVEQTDAGNRRIQFSYTDVFNDDNNSRNTYSYPTKIIDAANTVSTNNFSLVKYRFDMGANVWAKSPKPAGNNSGKETTRDYDSIGRPLKETIVNTGAYTRYEYPEPSNDNGVQRKVYKTLVNVDGDNDIAEDEVLTESWTDGAGRIRRSRTEHPGSTGGWTGTLTEYDMLGRVKRSSVPTEVSVNSSNEWTAAGDDATRGWLWTQSEYDWKGRVTRTINSDSNGSDGKDQLFSYDGCGCAGGQVTTIQSELVARDDTTGNARRTQKIYADILGRTWKTEIMDWSGSTVYTTTAQKYNGRDQVLETIQYAGAQNQNNTHQTVTMTYDGYGRMATRHYPIEDSNTDTSWTYNADDSIDSITDPRGATTEYTYNTRGLVEEIEYTPPANYPPPNSPSYMNIPDTPTVSFEYDALGNRTSMTDGLGHVTYEYDPLSRLTAENRYFTDDLEDAPLDTHNDQVFRIEYNYHLGGGLKYYKDPYGQQIDWTNDKAGRLTKVDGSEFGDEPTTHYAESIQYRAWGAIKQLNYKTEDNALVKMQYDDRLRVSQHEVDSSKWENGYVKKATFSYFADSRPEAMDNVVHPMFDRTFKYDHVGRLKENGFGTSPNNPFGQSMSYDSFSQMTNRNTTNWGENAHYTSTFTNGREQTQGVSGTAYDAAGNQINTGSRGGNLYQTSTYDAANRRVNFTSRNKRRSGRYFLITDVWHYGQYFDGDGHVLKQTRQLNNIAEHTSYQIWSSVLQSDLTEVNFTGKKVKTNVFAGNAVIAEQQSQLALDGSDGPKVVVWIHADPVTGSAQYVNKDGTNYYRKEFEPLGGQEVNPYGNEEEFPWEPDLSERSLFAVEDPQWQCGKDDKGFILARGCNQIQFETNNNVSALLPEKKKGNPLKIQGGGGKPRIVPYFCYCVRKYNSLFQESNGERRRRQRWCRGLRKG